MSMGEHELELFPDPENEQPEADADATDPNASKKSEPEEKSPNHSSQPPKRHPQRPSPSHYQRTVDLFGNPVYEGKRSPRKKPQSESPSERPRRGMPTEHQPTFFDDPPPASTEPSSSGNSRALSAAKPPRSVDQILPPPTKTASTPFHFPNSSNGISNGEKAKARDIIAAIQVLRAIDKKNRTANAEEQAILALFPGFGAVALSLFPNPVTGQYKDASWQALGEELQSLLTAEEYASAKRSTFNAFYTSPTVISAMHEGLSRLGVPPQSTILEPGCGSGNFLAQAPTGMRCIGIELDRLSGHVAQARFPQHDIRIEDFRDSKLPSGSIDAVIGNVPFADLKLDYRGKKLSLHDFFFVKSIDLLKPGGVLALVTTHYSLDKQNGTVREMLSAQADFVGAIRLPSDAFKREGTAVVADILFLRKRCSDQPAAHVDPDWLHVTPLSIDGVAIAINRYFQAHPEMILGRFTRKDTLYGGDDGYSIESTGDLPTQLHEAIERLPRFAATAAVHSPIVPSAQPYPSPLPPHISEGSFFVRDDGVICQLLDEKLVPVEYGGTTLQASSSNKTGKRLAALIRLRDLARKVLRSQNEGWLDADRETARKDLNWAYDNFVLTYGPINKTTLGESASGQTIRRMPNIVKFKEDPDAFLVFALEEYDETTDKARKAPIMNQDVVGQTPPITVVSSAEEGLLVSLDQRGGVDLPFIAKLYGKPEEQIITELADLIFHDPESQSWQTADEYLSGNVRQKLAQAQTAGPTYARNVARLEHVQPEDVLPGEIDANLGSPWIPEKDIHAFAIDLFQVDADSIEIAHLPKEALWSIEADYSALQSVAATSDYGTNRIGGIRLLELALNMKSPIIYDTIRHADTEERVVNQEDTLAAREKQKLIKERFKGWAFADPERSERLVRLYNDKYNNIRPRAFDGSHLEFPAMNTIVNLRAHQRDAIWRCMTAGNTLLAHVLGARKTYVMDSAGMKLKQTGLIQKPLYVVPNHMLEQFGREFLQLYPNARLLIAGKEDLRRDRRKLLTAKIASGSWDGVIVTHSSFERISMSREYQTEFLKREIAAYEQLLIGTASSNRAQKNLIKTIEKQKARRQEKLKDLLAAEKKDDGLVFDQLAVDSIFVDEAQFYKNLETATKMHRVAGIQTGGSERAFDLYMKTCYLQERSPGRGITFATGTPISNTMCEMFTMMRYLDPDGLRSRGIDHFDGWAAAFGEIVEAMEVSPDGSSLKPRSRFAKFVNLPELQQLFRAFADVQTADMLDLPRPSLENGKPTVIACPMSDEQHAIQQELVARYERIRSQKVDPREDNALAITTDGRKLALDARLLTAEALDYPESKVNRLVETVYDIWERTSANRSTQLIFSDIGVNPTAWGFSVYHDIIDKLIALGIPTSRIATIGTADTDAKKQVLFAKVRAGQVRVLLGSTTKMGMGTNVQKRLIALHHLDAPWKPAEVEQREGRILRQGNDNETVSIFRYVTEGSFDAFLWQTLETKAKFINQVISGTNASRQADDIGDQELSYAEVKAIASGNPAVLTLAETDAELRRLGILQRSHADEQFLARRHIRELPEQIDRLKQRLADLRADAAILEDNTDTAITINGTTLSSKDVFSVLDAPLKALPKKPDSPSDFPLGIYHGLRFGLRLFPFGAPDLFLQGNCTNFTQLTRDPIGPRAILNALFRLANSYDEICQQLEEKFNLSERQLIEYQARLGVPFPHNTYNTELESLRDQLKVCLSGTPEESLPCAAELAKRINVLKCTRSIVDTAERLGTRYQTVEEPVTTRIRKRMRNVLLPGMVDTGS